MSASTETLRSEILLYYMKNNKDIKKESKKILIQQDDQKISEMYNEINNKENDALNNNSPCLINFHSELEKYSKKINPSISRKSFIETVGKGEIKKSLKEILLNGANYRILTEKHIQTKIINSGLNLIKLLKLMISSCNKKTKSLPLSIFFLSVASNLLLEPKSSEEYRISLSILGLTNKSLDNVLDCDYTQLYDYCFDLSSTIKNFIETNYNYEKSKDSVDIPVSCCYVFNVISLMSVSALALQLRGSMKSMVGKLFEKLILGTTLTLYGFKYESNPPKNDDESKYKKLKKEAIPTFWLSSKESGGREKDATIIYKNKIIDIDIGLIGKGNPEVAADKLSRFKPEYKIKNLKFETKTIVVIANLNTGDIIKESAKKYKSSVVGIRNNSDWTLELYTNIVNFLNYNYHFSKKSNKYSEKLVNQIDRTDISQFFN